MAHKIKGIKITFQTIVEMLSWILVQPQVPGSSYLLKWCFLKHISQTISSEKSVTCWNAVSNESSIELKILRSSCELSILPSFPDDSDGHKSGNHTFWLTSPGDCIYPANSSLCFFFQLVLQLSPLQLSN